MIYFTSDLHFGHKNVIQHCNRPFSSVEEMDAKLIENWNKRVTSKDKDKVYVLGDFSFKEPSQYFNKLNGEKFLVYGNHDEKALSKLKKLFSWVKPYYDLKVQYNNERKHIILFHYSIRNWNRRHYNSWHLFGHSHGSLETTDCSIDVGVDCHNFAPISLDEVGAIMKTRKSESVDHHK